MNEWNSETLNSGNAYYHMIENFLPSHFYPKTKTLNYREIQLFPLFYIYVKLGLLHYALVFYVIILYFIVLLVLM